jgi:hypothetical protein
MYAPWLDIRSVVVGFVGFFSFRLVFDRLRRLGLLEVHESDILHLPIRAVVAHKLDLDAGEPIGHSLDDFAATAAGHHDPRTFVAMFLGLFMTLLYRAVSTAQATAACAALVQNRRR